MSYFESEAHAEEFRHQLLKAYEGEFDVLMAFIEVFTAHSEQLIRETRQSFEAGDGAEFTRHVHSIKGSLSQLYLSDLTAKAALIEKDSRANGLNPGVRARFEELAEELVLLNSWLKTHFLGQR